MTPDQTPSTNNCLHPVSLLRSKKEETKEDSKWFFSLSLSLLKIMDVHFLKSPCTIRSLLLWCSLFTEGILREG